MIANLFNYHYSLAYINNDRNCMLSAQCKYPSGSLFYQCKIGGGFYATVQAQLPGHYTLHLDVWIS